MERDIVYNFYDKAMVNNLEGNAQMIIYPEVNQNTNIQHEVKSRTQEYADKWDMNMFLNDFKEWDENAGVNVKLSDVYLEEHLPHFKWKNNSKESAKLKELLSEYINEYHGKKMLLILGQPGIGKSTLITWITANFKDRKDNILVYQFAADLKNVDWSNTGEDSSLADDILKELNLSYESLNGKTLIIDGFDEISVGSDRADILNRLYWQLIERSLSNDFSLIVTCRENYVQKLQPSSYAYIFLQPWDEEQIRNFCAVYSDKAKCKISENTIMNILENKEILGIPLILYMVLALNISIENESSIVDVYDKIFALDGGIYDRCINNGSYASPHRIGEIKKQIHQISREIAFWIFENNSDKASILYEKYQEICNIVMETSHQKKEIIEQDFLIGNYFKKIRHCEGIETEEISFVHRTIYEYFVAEMIYNSIEEAMIELSDESQKKFAENIAWFLKQGEVTYTIRKYLQHKILKLYDNLDSNRRQGFYKWWENSVENMMSNGMFYYTERKIQEFNNIIKKELRCFLNIACIFASLHSISENKYVMINIDREILEKYIKYSFIEFGYVNEEKVGTEEIYLNYIDLREINLNVIDLRGSNFNRANLVGIKLTRANLSETKLSRVNFSGAKLSRAILKLSDLRESNLNGVDLRGGNLRGANLSKVNMSETDLRGANLREVDLSKANISKSNLSGADLSGANLSGVNLQEANLDKANLSGVNLSGTDLSKTSLKGVKIAESFRKNKLLRTNIEASIWRKDDIQKVMQQLKEIEFEHIIIEDENGRKRVSKNELFPDLQ